MCLDSATFILFSLREYFTSGTAAVSGYKHTREAYIAILEQAMSYVHCFI